MFRSFSDCQCAVLQPFARCCQCFVSTRSQVDAASAHVGLRRSADTAEAKDCHSQWSSEPNPQKHILKARKHAGDSQKSQTVATGRRKSSGTHFRRALVAQAFPWTSVFLRSSGRSPGGDLERARRGGVADNKAGGRDTEVPQSANCTEVLKNRIGDCLCFRSNL